MIRGRLFQLPTHSESSSRRNLHKLLDSLEVIPDPTVYKMKIVGQMEPNSNNLCVGDIEMFCKGVAGASTTDCLGTIST